MASISSIFHSTIANAGIRTIDQGAYVVFHINNFRLDFNKHAPCYRIRRDWSSISVR